MMNKELWGVFHDGVITRVEGDVPGDLALQIEIDYLRKMLPGEGDGFCVQLSGCTLIEFENWDGKIEQTPERLAAQDIELLYIKTLDPLALDCNEGILRLVYQAAQVTLDSGEIVSDEALWDASSRYWTAFKERAEAFRKS
jgi:hypothetical protein